MALEDFTTYTELDAGGQGNETGHIQFTANHIDFDVYENEDSYLYKDYGAEHFTDFDHLVDISLTDVTGVAVAGGVWALSEDTVDDFYGLQTTDKTALVVFPYTASVASRRIYLREIYGGLNYDDYWGFLVSGTKYYLRIVKSGTSLVCGIYSTRAKAEAGNGIDGDLDNLALTLHADHSFRYIFGAISYNIGDTGETCSNTIDDLDLQEVVALDNSGSIISILKSVGIISLVKPKFKPLLPKFMPRTVI